MNPTMTPMPTAARPKPPTPAAARHDLYAPLHEALRRAMCDTLAAFGRMHAADEDAVRRTIDGVDALLALCDDQLRAENLLVHPFIESRALGATQRVAAEHVAHLDHIADLRDEAARLRTAFVDRAAPVLRLYRRLALFVAEQLRHMHFEATALNALLWQHFDDAELRALSELVAAWLAAATRSPNRAAARPAAPSHPRSPK